MADKRFISNSTAAGRGPWLADAFAAQCVVWARQAGCPAPRLAMLQQLARRLMLAIQAGHVCLPLQSEGDEFDPLDESADWPSLLAETGVVDCVSSAQTTKQPSQKPLVLDGGALYLARHWHEEVHLAKAIRQRAAQGRLGVLSGGPGTGKTTAIARLLGRLLARQPNLRVVLAAPTGKAAARMVEALQGQVAEGATGNPPTATTIHRLLGITPHQPMPYHGPERPLALDVLIVDEASMLDQALAYQLLQALPPEAVLLLLGDKDQLAAVESGAVFAALSAHSTQQPTTPAAIDACLDRLLPSDSAEQSTQASLPGMGTLAECVIWLQTSYRFKADSPLGQLASAVREGDVARCLALLPDLSNQSPGPAAGTVTCPHQPLAWWPDLPNGSLLALLEQGYAAYWSALQAYLSDSAGQVNQMAAPLFAALGQFRVLAAVHGGSTGVRLLNRELTQRLSQRTGVRQQAGLPLPGLPILVLENDPASGLYNGDVGIVLPAGTGWAVWFPDGQGAYRAIPWSTLPSHEPAWVMTVHKAQGSEFERVALILPQQSNPVLTRELVYTGLTRARQGLWLVGPAACLAEALNHPTQRDAGLAQRLR